MVDELGTWLAAELKQRGWSMSEMGRRAGYSSTHISDVINGAANPSADFLIAVANALGEIPQRLLELAGHLPATPPPTDLSCTVNDAFRQLADTQQHAIATIVFALAGKPESPQTLAASRSGQALPVLPQLHDLSATWDDVCTEMEHCANLLLDDWTTERGTIVRHFRVLSSTLAKALLDTVGDPDRAEWSVYVHRLLEAHRRHSTQETTPRQDQHN